MMFKTPGILSIVLLSLFLGTVTAQQCSLQDDEFFISFHPHLDAYWLNTDDELKNINFRPEGFLYAMNQRNAKQIFNTMIEGLQGNASRKYFVTEGVFFKDWYDSLQNDKKNKVKQFIKNGQLQITNGGWVQNDQAVCYVDDIFDQYTVGHNFFYSQFEIVPKVAWATDSFGHSHSQAAIEHLVGFQIQGIERIDDRYIYKRNGGPLLEFYWSPVSDSNGRKYGGVYTHIRHFLHEFVDYRRMTPQGLSNDHKRVQTTMKKMYNKNKLFRFVGNDFEEFATQQFSVLQRALNQMNQNSKAECKHYKWGNPSDYFKYAKDADDVPVRESDFLPNFDQDHYWSGYYTTNPELKIVCKDFSRILNLFRKVFIKERVSGKKEDFSMRVLLNKADELLAVNQHHDGITATSKYHIEELQKNRMRESSTELIKAIGKLRNKDTQPCRLYSSANRCTINSLGASTIYLTVLHEGAPKIQRIQVNLPHNLFYEAEQDDKDSIFCPAQGGNCVLVFDAPLVAGENVFKLNQASQGAPGLVTKWLEKGVKHEGDKFQVQLDGAKIHYKLKNGDYFQLHFVRSSNSPSSTSTTTWNKFGQPINKNQRRIAGIYIMSNNGQIQSIPDLRWSNLKVVQGRSYSKISAESSHAKLQITIQNSELSILSVESSFQPSNTQQFDYFLKIDSSLKATGAYYHDVAGLLVSKRQIGKRHDYQWTYKPQDKINANNYPMCSFGYVIQGDRKMVVFTDRAQGFTRYDEGLLVNIDRLTGDDWKGAGEGYLRTINNTFKFKIGLVPKDKHIERQWQRMYDQALVGYLSAEAPSRADNNKDKKNVELLKYTVFSLNQNQFVVRLYNLNEQQEIHVPKFGQSSWKIQTLGLDLKYINIKESFANGVPLSYRKVWKKLQGQINIFNAGSKDTHENLVLQPLQVRSFRVNLKEAIKLLQQEQPLTRSDAPAQSQSHEQSQATSNNEQKQLAQLSLTQEKPLVEHFARRCF